MRSGWNLPLALLLSTSCAVLGGSFTATFRVEVTDEEGKPLEGARVIATFNEPDEMGLKVSQLVDVPTDTEGRATVSGRSRSSSAFFGVEKAGYYSYRQPIRVGGGMVGEATPLYRVTLQRRGEGADLVRSEIRGKRFPVRGEFVGFDFMVGDWVALHGKGEVADVEMKVEFVDLDVPDDILQRQPGLGRNQHRFEARFPEGAGIQVHYAHRDFGSVLMFPRHAPEGGYQRTLVYESTWYLTEEGIAGVRYPTEPQREDLNYIIRFRPVLDKEGNLVSAYHGVILRNIVRQDFLGQAAVLRYLYNPTPGDRTLEARPPPPPPEPTPRPPSRGPAFHP